MYNLEKIDSWKMLEMIRFADTPLAGWWGIAFDVCVIIMHSEPSYNVKEHHLATIELCSYCCNEMEIS